MIIWFSFSDILTNRGRVDKKKLNNVQLKRLEHYFEIDPHPTRKKRIQLAKELSLSEYKINRWFQRRRYLDVGFSLKSRQNAYLYQPYPAFKSPTTAIAYPTQEYYHPQEFYPSIEYYPPQEYYPPPEHYPTVTPLSSVNPSMACKCSQCLTTVGQPFPASWSPANFDLNSNAKGGSFFEYPPLLKPHKNGLDCLLFGSIREPSDLPPNLCFQEHRYPPCQYVNNFPEDWEPMKQNGARKHACSPAASSPHPATNAETFDKNEYAGSSLPGAFKNGTHPQFNHDGLPNALTGLQPTVTLDLSQVDYKPRFVTEDGTWQTGNLRCSSSDIKYKLSVALNEGSGTVVNRPKSENVKQLPLISDVLSLSSTTPLVKQQNHSDLDTTSNGNMSNGQLIKLEHPPALVRAYHPPPS